MKCIVVLLACCINMRPHNGYAEDHAIKCVVARVEVEVNWTVV